jgi:hypothetical protein
MGIVRWNDQANRWIDGLSTVPRLLVWAGMSLATALTVVVVEYSPAGRGSFSLRSLGQPRATRDQRSGTATASALKFDALPHWSAGTRGGCARRPIVLRQL